LWAKKILPVPAYPVALPRTPVALPRTPVAPVALPSHAGGAAPPSQHLRRCPSLPALAMPPCWWKTCHPGSQAATLEQTLVWVRPARPSPTSLSCAHRPPSTAQTGIPRQPGVLGCIQWISPKGKIETLTRPIPITTHCSSYVSRRLVVSYKSIVNCMCCQICGPILVRD
jgi:hypothetical protein